MLLEILSCCQGEEISKWQRALGFYSRMLELLLVTISRPCLAQLG
jgi:hypothetical protein